MNDATSAWEKVVSFLYSDITPEEEFPAIKPLLAHYTSLGNLEKILIGREIWLSNPLFMNDIEELRFGVEQGVAELRSNSDMLRAFPSNEIHAEFMSFIEAEYNRLQFSDAIDLYVACFSLHDENEIDGRLAMWRGYGSNGNGAALILDVAKIPDLPDDLPFVLSKVEYASTEERIAWIRSKINDLAKLLGEISLDRGDFEPIASAIFERLVIFSLFTKHRGFLEEQEWRLVYLKSRDRQNIGKEMLGYLNGPRGVEPKLKLQVESFVSRFGVATSFEDMVHSVILGPTSSSPLSFQSTKRMLHLIGYTKLSNRLGASSIPYRG